MIGVHDFVLMMAQPERLERALGPVRLAAARPDLLDAQLAISDRRKDRVAARFAFAVFPCWGQSTHGSLFPQPARRFPGERDRESLPAPRRARARPAARSSVASGHP